MAKDILSLDSVKARSLKDTSFTEDKPDTVKRRLICDIRGETGSGKNELLFTFPDPIAFMSFDPNYITAYNKAKKKGVTIHLAKYDVPIVKPDARNGDTIASACGDTWNRFAKDFMGALRDPNVETIAIDTGTELYELIVLALYGKNVQIMPKDRGHAYATFRQVVREAESSDKNLVFLSKLKDEWKNDKSTGNRIRAGYKDLDYCVSTEILMTKVDEEPFPDRYHALVQKCHLQPEIEGQELTGDMITHENLAMMVWG